MRDAFVFELSKCDRTAEQAGITVELIAPVVGGVAVSDGEHLPADQKIDGGPPVLYDAVIVLAAKDGAAMLAALPAARDFVSDASAHCKFLARCGQLRFWERQMVTA